MSMMHELRLLFNHIILAGCDLVLTYLRNTDVWYSDLVLDSLKRAQVCFHGAGCGKVPHNRFLEMFVTFECIHYSSIA